MHIMEGCKLRLGLGLGLTQDHTASANRKAMASAALVRRADDMGGAEWSIRTVKSWIGRV